LQKQFVKENVRVRKSMSKASVHFALHHPLLGINKIYPPLTASNQSHPRGWLFVFKYLSALNSLLDRRRQSLIIQKISPQEIFVDLFYVIS